MQLFPLFHSPFHQKVEKLFTCFGHPGWDKGFKKLPSQTPWPSAQRSQKKIHSSTGYGPFHSIVPPESTLSLIGTSSDHHHLLHGSIYGDETSSESEMIYSININRTCLSVMIARSPSFSFCLRVHFLVPDLSFISHFASFIKYLVLISVYLCQILSALLSFSTQKIKCSIYGGILVPTLFTRVFFFLTCCMFLRPPQVKCLPAMHLNLSNMKIETCRSVFQFSHKSLSSLNYSLYLSLSPPSLSISRSHYACVFM